MLDKLSTLSTYILLVVLGFVWGSVVIMLITEETEFVGNIFKAVASVVEYFTSKLL